MTFDGLRVYVDGEFHKLGHIKDEDLKDDSLDALRYFRGFTIAPVSNNWRRYHGEKPRRKIR